ncbi:MAG: alpha-galactosidase [Epulopiscium sp. Nele67-Bin005]|nr:MAG: alpha-galactosidase [Epulopiscium sp. Nele67-Bin005]
MIYVNESKQHFSLQTANTSYVFCVDGEGLLRHLYWGSKIENTEELEYEVLCEVSTNDPVHEITPEEFPVYGGLLYKQHCLKAKFQNGDRGIFYQYEGYTQEQNTLTIHLKDKYRNLLIDLEYKCFEEYDLLERKVTITNNTDETITLEQLQTGQFHIKKTGLKFSNVHGHWGAEQNRFEQEVSYGKILIECRRGISTHNHNPYFILHDSANEDAGDVYFGALRMSGNFRGVIEQTPYGETLVQLGLNSHDFNAILKPSEKMESPSIICGYSNGFAAMSHNLHSYARKTIMKPTRKMVLYNSWEATEFKVTCDHQIELAKKAAKLGAELFVLDDGWFGQRDSIENGLGDWYINEEKFPNGLNPLIDVVKENGMKFGIWIEPEMVNPLSDLYKQHPEWIYHFDKVISDTSRGQYVLNITLPEVKSYILNMIEDLLTKHDIAYIKWDANRPISQSSSDKQIWHNHILAVYDIVAKAKEKFPDVIFEACASGGGRIDYGALTYFDDFWTSDNTDAFDRLTIQESYSYIYPIKAMRAWVTDCPNFLSKRYIPLRFRFHSAMMGTLGIGSNILKISEEEETIYKDMIAQYKEIAHIVQEGDFYRLKPISQNKYYAYQYVFENESLLYVFLPQTLIGHNKARILLKGLSPKTTYKVSYQDVVIEKSGEYLMNFGIQILLSGDYASEIVKINAVYSIENN